MARDIHAGEDTPPDGDRASHGRWPSVSWCAGADARILARCRGERMFYNGLGLAVLLVASFGGTAACLAIGYALQEPATHLWPVGVIWALFIGNTDRLILMLSSARHRLLAAIPRVLVSLFIGILISGPLTLWILHPEINSQLQADVQHAVQRSDTGVTQFYVPKIKADRVQIAAIRGHENKLTQKIDQNKFLSACEAGETTCSTTHKLGCQAYCRHYAQLASTYQAELNTIKPQDRSEIATLETDITKLHEKMQSAKTRGSSAITNSRGLIARTDALAEIEHKHQGVVALVWVLRGVFILVDMIAITIKILRESFGNSAYEAIAASAHRAEGLLAKRQDETTRVDEELIAEQGRADIEVGRVRIAFEAERLIAEEEARAASSPAGRGAAAGARAVTDRPQIAAMSLRAFGADMSAHEMQQVPVDPRLARAGRIGTILIAAFALAIGLYTRVSHGAVAGEWIVFIAIAIVASLGAYTRWFTSAPRWALRPIFGTLLLGLALPPLIIAINL